MIDLHLINATLASLGIGAAVVLLIAAAVIAITAVRRRTGTLRRSQLPAAPQATAVSTPPDKVRREPALR